MLRTNEPGQRQAWRRGGVLGRSWGFRGGRLGAVLERRGGRLGQHPGKHPHPGRDPTEPVQSEWPREAIEPVQSVWTRGAIRPSLRSPNGGRGGDPTEPVESEWAREVI